LTRSDAQIIVAAEVTQDPSDDHQLARVVSVVVDNLRPLGMGEPIGAVVADAGYWSPESAGVTDGPQLFVASRPKPVRTQAPLPPTGRIRASATPLQLMERRLGARWGRAIYAKRGMTVEPVFGQIKQAHRARRFQRRGLSAVACERTLLATTPNILKIWRMTTAIG